MVVGWSPPMNGSYKLNFDGSLLNFGHAATSLPYWFCVCSNLVYCGQKDFRSVI